MWASTVTEFQGRLSSQPRKSLQSKGPHWKWWGPWGLWWRYRGDTRELPQPQCNSEGARAQKLPFTGIPRWEEDARPCCPCCVSSLTLSCQGRMWPWLQHGGCVWRLWVYCLVVASLSLFIYLFLSLSLFKLFIWLYWVLVAACSLLAVACGI